MKLKKFILDILRGIGIGVAAIIPGVSGGSVAVIFKIYEKLVGAIHNLFKNFVKELSNFYSLFIQVDYENIVLFLKKADELDISIDYYSGLCGIKKEYELKIIEEDFSESMLLAIINNMSQENRNKFFNQNKKALFLYRKLNVDNIIESKLPDTIIEDKYFLDTIQHESLLEFRKRINTLAMNNDDYIVEQKFEKWKDDGRIWFGVLLA